MSTYLLLEFGKQRQPGMIQTTSSSSLLVKENIDINTISPRCLAWQTCHTYCLNNLFYIADVCVLLLEKKKASRHHHLLLAFVLSLFSVKKTDPAFPSWWLICGLCFKTIRGETCEPRPDIGHIFLKFVKECSNIGQYFEIILSCNKICGLYYLITWRL